MCRDGGKFVTHHLLFVCLLFFHIYIGPRYRVAAQQNATTTPVNVGVVLNLDSVWGMVGLSCISMALSDFYSSHSSCRTRLILNARNSNGDAVTSAAAAVDLIKNVEVQAIIGPDDSTSTDFVIDLGDKSHVPVVSFSATSPFLSTIRNPYFIRAVQNDSSQVNAISAVIRAFGWKRVALMYVDNEFGEGVVPSLVDALQDVDAQVPYRSVIPPSATDDQILEQLYKLMSMQTRVFVVHMLPSLGTRIFAKAKQIGMMNEGYVWVMTNGITDLLSLIDPTVSIISMQGLVGVRTYYPNTTRLNDFSSRWKIKFRQDNPTIPNPTLNIFGLQAYDATYALAMAVEELGVANCSFQRPTTPTASTDLEDLGVSQCGQKLVQILAATSFTGLAGNFSLVDGQLPTSMFQIVNVDGDEVKGIGYWSSTQGLMNTSSYPSSGTAYSTSKDNLATIKWPGYSISIPKGWEIPTNGKSLVIGVPVKDGYTEFVRVMRDNSTGKTNVDGFCIAVFEAVIEALPYAVTYEFVPFALPNGSSAGTYNDLIDQVYYQDYDAAVGDITIVANRTAYVDFTLPFTPSGVSMIVRFRSGNRKNPWAFLKPLTWDLWLASGCSFFFIAFVVWVLEHQINDDFRGPPFYQVGTSFWFSFSTLAFAQREKIMRNLTRFVMIVWIFVVLILTQSYTGSLASQLTVPNLQPSVSSVDDLIRQKVNVGYKESSFLKEMLLQRNFEASKLKPFSSPEECHDLLSRGSANDGVDAAFDEIPYIKLFLSTYCNQYTMVPVNFETSGFGFAFPLGSPLVRDVSRAILTVSEGPKMKEIEDTWLLSKNCTGSNVPISPDSLGLDSFWGLFLLVWVAGFLALFIFLAMFLCRHRDVFRESSSWIERASTLSQRFKDRDETWHSFRRSDQDRSTNNNGNDEMSQLEPSPRTEYDRRTSSSPSARSADPVFVPEQIIYPTDPNNYASSSASCRPFRRLDIVRSISNTSNYEMGPLEASPRMGYSQGTPSPLARSVNPFFVPQQTTHLSEYMSNASLSDDELPLLRERHGKMHD